MKNRINWSEQIAKALKNQPQGLNQKEIITKLNTQFLSVDRVTIYRNLKRLTQSGAVHQLSDNRYLYCQHNDKKKAHIILFCQECNRSTELDDQQHIQELVTHLVDIKFFSKTSILTIKGQCQKCS